MSTGVVLHRGQCVDTLDSKAFLSPSVAGRSGASNLVMVNTSL